MEEVPGSQPSPKTKIQASSTALAYSGMEVVVMEKTEITRSCAEPSFMPASTPRVRATMTMTTKVTPARMPVLPSRSQKISFTGRL